MTMFNPLISAKVRRTARRSAPWKSRLTGFPLYLDGFPAIGGVWGAGAGAAGGVCAAGVAGGGAWDGPVGGTNTAAGGACACAIIAAGWGAAGLVGPARTAAAFTCADGAAASSMIIVSDCASSDGSMWYADFRDISTATRVSNALLSLMPMRTFCTAPCPTGVRPG